MFSGKVVGANVINSGVLDTYVLGVEVLKGRSDV